jgi:ribonuclease HI
MRKNEGPATAVRSSHRAKERSTVTILIPTESKKQYQKLAVEIYCDGACIPNPGQMGCGIVRGDETISLFLGPGSNQRAELMAIHESVELAGHGDIILSDSRYAIEVSSGGWHAQVHLDLIKDIRKLLETKRVSLRWIRGHNGHPLQELADRLAKQAASTRRSTIDSLVNLSVGTRIRRVGA